MKPTGIQINLTLLEKTDDAENTLREVEQFFIKLQKLTIDGKLVSGVITFITL